MFGMGAKESFKKYIEILKLEKKTDKIILLNENNEIMINDYNQQQHTDDTIMVHTVYSSDQICQHVHLNAPSRLFTVVQSSDIIRYVIKPVPQGPKRQFNS